MSGLYAAEQLPITAAETLLKGISYMRLRQSSLWATRLFTRSDLMPNLLGNLPRELARAGYSLYRAEVAPRSILADKCERIPVLFWGRTVPEGQIAEVYHANAYPLTGPGEEHLLVQQAYLIRQAYQNGVADRSRAVSAQMADLLGVDPARLSEVLGGD